MANLDNQEFLSIVNVDVYIDVDDDDDDDDDDVLLLLAAGEFLVLMRFPLLEAFPRKGKIHPSKFC